MLRVLNFMKKFLSNFFWFFAEKFPFRFFGIEVFGIKRQGALGDVILITPIIREIKRRHPRSLIWVQTSFKEVFYSNPFVNRVVSHGIQNKPCRFIDLDLAYEKRPMLHVVDAYSQEIFGSFIEDKSLSLYSSKKDLRFLLKRFNPSYRPYVVMHQAVSWQNRTWPKEYWDQLVISFLSRGFLVVLVGKKKDFSYEGNESVINLHSLLSLAQIKELIENSQLFIGPDSAIIHVAMTTSTPIVGLFTIADPKLRITRENGTICLIPKSSCRFCLHKEPAPVTTLECRFKTNHCTKEITPDEVLEASMSLLLKT